MLRGVARRDRAGDYRSRGRVAILSFVLRIVVMLASMTALGAAAQAPRRAPAGAAPKPAGTLAQVMRGVYFPNANLIYDVQQRDPAVPKPSTAGAAGSATSTYGNAYTGWEVVENAAVALADGVDLILTPGRSCQNGKPVPIQQADFQQFARDMRAAGEKVLQAARTKNQENVSDATNDLADACVSCHEVYRDKGPAESPARCTPPAR
jgi:cytochrome c'